MTELLVYAPGIRQEEKLVQFSHQIDMLATRYKVDAAHDLIYFEVDDAEKISLRQINNLFENIGLRPRFVGHIPESVRQGDDEEDESSEEYSESAAQV